MVRKFGSNAWTGIVNGFTLALAAGVLYMMWKHPPWDFLLTLVCIAVPMLMVIGFVSHLYARQWERQSR